MKGLSQVGEWFRGGRLFRTGSALDDEGEAIADAGASTGAPMDEAVPMTDNTGDGGSGRLSEGGACADEAVAGDRPSRAIA